jgi:soluble lytic murein transglycosylase-like protein
VRISVRPCSYTTINLLLVLLALGFGTPNPALAQQLPPLEYNASTSEAIVLSYAIKYGVKGDELLNTLKCESGLNPKAVGDHGTSYGIAQIHLPAHKDISKAQALDPFFAIDFAAKQFSLGNAGIWTCHHLLYGSEKS